MTEDDLLFAFFANLLHLSLLLGRASDALGHDSSSSFAEKYISNVTIVTYQYKPASSGCDSFKLLYNDRYFTLLSVPSNST